MGDLKGRFPVAQSPDNVETIIDPRDAASPRGYDTFPMPGPAYRRKKAGTGFTYTRADGSRLSENDVLKRIKALAIPPAWTDVWICPFADGHIQATGRDAKGRKQYRYHARFREVRESTKYEHVVAFADALPAIREKVQEHMALRGLPREKVLATVVHLLETTLIRVGNDDYAKQNNSYGLTTLKNRHVAVDGNEVRFRFTGKSGKQWSLRVRDRRIAKIIKACQELPGQELLQYVDEAGNCQDVTSTDVNDYLKEITGKDITAKDFRTWAGTVLAAMALNELESFDSAAQAKRNLRAAIEKVAGRLGNTPTICRKCYVHPEVLNSYLDGNLVLELKSQAESELRSTVQSLKPEEAAVLALLRGRLAKEAERPNRPKNSARRPPESAILSSFAKDFARVLDGLHRRLGSLPADDLELLVLKLVGRDEELLKLFLDRPCQVAHVLQSPLGMRAPRHGKQTVVALGFAFALLLDLENADDAAGDDKARECRRVMDHHDVERVAVIGFGRGHEAPIVGIGQAGQQRFAEGEGFELRVVGEFRAAAAGCFDDDMDVAVFREGRQVDEIGHGVLSRTNKMPSNQTAVGFQSWQIGHYGGRAATVAAPPDDFSGAPTF